MGYREALKKLSDAHKAHAAASTELELHSAKSAPKESTSATEARAAAVTESENAIAEAIAEVKASRDAFSPPRNRKVRVG